MVTDRIQLLNGTILELSDYTIQNNNLTVNKFGKRLLVPDNIVEIDSSIYNDLISFLSTTNQRINPFTQEEIYPEINSNSSIEDTAQAGEQYLNYVDKTIKERFKGYVVSYYLNENTRMIYFFQKTSNASSASIRIIFISNLFFLTYRNSSGSSTSSYFIKLTEVTLSSKPKILQSILDRKCLLYIGTVRENYGNIEQVRFLVLPHDFKYNSDGKTISSDYYYQAPGFLQYFHCDLDGNRKMPLENNWWWGDEESTHAQRVQVSNDRNYTYGVFPFTCVARADGKTIPYVRDIWDIIYAKNLIEFGDIVDDTKIPDNPGGASGTGGGDGDFDDSSDVIDIPYLPPSYASNNMVNFYVPTQIQLSAISRYLWSALDVESFKRLITDPMNAFISLNYIPYRDNNATLAKFVVGNIETDIDVYKTSAQFVEIDCGELNLKEFWGNYLDYSPYTKVEIYLPYIGVKQLDVDEVMGANIKVVYHLDITTGACVCFVKISKGNLNSVLYNYEGNCSVNIPLTSNDFRNTISAIASLIADGGMMVSTAGMPSTVRIGSAIKTLSDVYDTVSGGGKPLVQKSGTLTANHGAMGIQKPYLIVTRPRQCVPAQQKKYTAYPAFITERLGSLSGFTKVDSIHLDNVTATDIELEEIEELLKEGVIL